MAGIGKKNLNVLIYIRSDMFMISDMRNDLDIGLLRAFTIIVDAGGGAAPPGARRLPGQPASQQVKRFGRRSTAACSSAPAAAYAGRRAAVGTKLGGSPGAQRRVWSSMRTPSFEGEVRLACPTTSSRVSCRPSLPLRQGPAARHASAWSARIRGSCASNRLRHVDRPDHRTRVGRRTARPCAPIGWSGSACRAAMPISGIHCRSLGASTCVFRSGRGRGAGKARAIGVRSAR